MRHKGETETQKIIEWQALEYPFWKKTAGWYSSVAIIGLAIALSSVIMGNFIFAVLVTISTFALLLMASIPPKKIKVSITKKGVVLGSYLYGYKNLESFSINELDSPPRLYLKSKRIFSPLIITEIVGVKNEDIRKALKQRLDEEELFEPLFHRLLEYLGF